MEFTDTTLISEVGYEGDTGALRRKATGKQLGWVRADGYIGVKIGRRYYLAHRVAWLLVHGDWPKGHLDHINGDRADNRMANLREATHAENLHNRGRNKNNTSGYKGVSLHRSTGKWDARIMVNRKQVYLGIYETQEDAHAAYTSAAAKLHGTFARTS